VERGRPPIPRHPRVLRPRLGHTEGVEEPPGEIWVSDRVTVAPSAIEGLGLHALDDLAPGMVVIRLAGRLVSSGELAEILAAADIDEDAPPVDTITVYEDRHLVLPSATVVHYGNHSCDPNMWHVGPYEIGTRRKIGAGEELTVDYGTHSGMWAFRLRCTCRSSLCRGEVTSDDWRRPELQDRYRGHWVPALKNRIRST
jgi:hypothetical protein